MDYPIVYDKLTENPSGFLGYGLAIVENAKDICITEVLNGEYTLSFALPISDPKWQFIVEENFVKMEGQLFVIRNVSDSHGTDEMCTVSCEHVFFLLLDEYIEWLEIAELTSANKALTDVLQGTEFTVGTVDITKTNDDIVIIENQNPVAAINNAINIWGGEIKIDNWSVGLLTHRGSTAPNIQFRYRKNMKNIKRTVDSSSLVTRLYAYGNDGLTIEDAVENTSTLKYIDSQYINSYRRPKKGTVNFDTGDPDELYTKALEYLAKAEIPAVTYEVDVIELKKLAEYGELETFGLGDEAMVIDEELGINVQARILEYSRYPLEPTKSKVTLANFRPGIENTLSELRSLKNQITTGDGSIKVSTSWFEGVINVLQNQLLASGSYATKEAVVAEGKGVIFENTNLGSNDYGALFIGPGILAIANEKIGSEWNWRAFGTGDGFTGDLITAGKVKSTFIEIGSSTTYAVGYDPNEKNGIYNSVTDPSLLWNDFASHINDLWTNSENSTIKTWMVDSENEVDVNLAGSTWQHDLIGTFYIIQEFECLSSTPKILTRYGAVGSNITELSLWKTENHILTEKIANTTAPIAYGPTLVGSGFVHECYINLDPGQTYGILAKYVGGTCRLDVESTAWEEDLVVGHAYYCSASNTNFDVGDVIENNSPNPSFVSYSDGIWGKTSIIDDWVYTGKTTIDGGKIETNSITAEKLVADQAFVDWLNARNIIAGSVKAENIDTTTAKISTAQIEDLFIGTGGNVTMGAGAVIAWENLDATCQTNLKGETGPQGPQGVQGIQGPAGDDANIPQWITDWGGQTVITGGWIATPKMFVGSSTSSVASGIRVESTGIMSYYNNALSGFSLGNDGTLELWYSGNQAAEFRYDTNGAGTASEAANRVFIASLGTNALKIQTENADMSIEAKGTGKKLFIGGNVAFTGSVTGLRAQWG